jgi:hypothetical protein
VEKVALDQKGVKEVRAGVEKSSKGISIRVKTASRPISTYRICLILQALSSEREGSNGIVVEL